MAVGESFLLQVKVDGDDSPGEPDLSGLQDFTVQSRGGGQNNRESITIINGKMNRVSEHGYVFRYALTPKRDGILTIPALAITAAGKTLFSQPITIKVSKPQLTDEFKLHQNLSETECYVGQPLVFSVVWYVNRDIEEFQFLLPVFEDKRFEIADFPEDRNYAGQDAIAINLHGSKVIARKGKVGQHTTVTVRGILIPREPGVYALEPASVSSRVVTGYQQQRGGQPFNNRFFDDKGYPAVKPPWGTLSAVDMNIGKILWQVPLGEHKELTAKGIPKTGTENYGGPLLTSGGILFIGASKDEYFSKWGRHYLPSLSQSHLLQRCNNFKDPGIQHYGGE